MFLEHPLIRPDAIESRRFQLKIAEECLDESTLVVLPTGLGKTVVALIVIADILKAKSGKVLFMAPTKPLVDQHASFLTENLVIEGPISTFTGEVKPEEREELWKESRIIVSTPQVIENDIDAGRGSVTEFDLIVFDEAHRAVGDYAYVRIAAKYSLEKDEPLVLGMTASPGYDIEKIAEVCKNISITNIAIRSELDEDVAPYVYGIAVERVFVNVPEEMDEITELLGKVLDDKINALRKYKLLDPKRRATVRDLLEAGNVIRAKLNSGKKNFHMYRALSIQAMAMKVSHAIDLAKTQGPDSLRNYISKIVEEAGTKDGSKAAKELVKDARFEMARRLLDSSKEGHPKLEMIQKVVSDQLSRDRNSRIIIFTHYRDTCDQVTHLLEELPGARPVRFVGQATHGEDSGLNQREQKEIVARFKKGERNVLVATSVAEEGLDIPSTDLVVFYEPIPSEIRTIQRRGRTGRHRPGRVVVLLARDTKDETYHYSSRRKEDKMRRQLESLRRRLRVAKRISSESGQPIDVDRFFDESPSGLSGERRARSMSKSQTLLSDFGAVQAQSMRLLADPDRNRDVLRALEEIGLRFESKSMKPEDFIIGSEIAVVRETIDRFLEDIDHPETVSRIATLQDRYRRPILVVEGEGISGRGIPDKLPIFDALNSLIRDLKIPLMPTNGHSDTAAFIASLVKSEMTRESPGQSSKSETALFEYQKRMIEGLPNVTSVLAERLLDRFGSVQRILGSSKEELMSVEGVGNVIAEEIIRIATERYKSDRTS